MAAAACCSRTPSSSAMRRVIGFIGNIGFVVPEGPKAAMVAANAGFEGGITDWFGSFASGECDAHRLWSLWDLFNFIFVKWHPLLSNLDILIRVAAARHLP